MNAGDIKGTKDSIGRDYRESVKKAERKEKDRFMFDSCLPQRKIDALQHCP
jgi:hypothetical protein